MNNIDFLLIDDDRDQEKLFVEAIEEIRESKDSNITYKVVKTPEEAMTELYQNCFRAIIIDLKLKNEDDSVHSDEEISGNILLKKIIEKEIIPIVVITGFPDKVSDDIDTDIVEVCPKEVNLYDVINNLIEKYSNSVFKIFGSRGKINEDIKELFWKVMPNYFVGGDGDISQLPSDKQEKVIVRYISSWFSNKYMFEDKYLDVDPIEMYMFPNPIEQVCTCDVFQKKIDDNSFDYYIVLTPSCDLANKKVDEVLLCKIKKYDDVHSFKNKLDAYNNLENKTSNKAIKKKEDLSKWFRNSDSESLRYHFLPKISQFSGGFVDFRAIITLEYDNESGKIKDETYTKVGVITESFKRDIISRFSSYYHRQGQPEFNCESVLSHL